MACIDGGYVYTNGNGTAIELDALLIPNVGGGGASSSFSSVLDVSYIHCSSRSFSDTIRVQAATYPGITIPIDIDPWKLPLGLGVWGRAYGEGSMVKWTSAMEDLFQFNANFQPEFINFNTTKMPFDARWVSSLPVLA